MSRLPLLKVYLSGLINCVLRNFCFGNDFHFISFIQACISFLHHPNVD